MKKTLTLALLLSCCLANAQGIFIQGNIDCGMWIEARSKRMAITFEHFIVGMVNGLAVGSELDIWRGKGIAVTQEQYFYWMDGYCKNKPLNSVLQGVNDFANEMTDGRFIKRRR
jgi:hypothetical protein